MCLLAVFCRVAVDAPLVVAANREERFDRGGEPPAVRVGPVPFVGGIDPAQGGTWLGVNARSVVVAVTNRPKTQLPGQPRSRGLLARDLLSAESAAEATERAVRELDSGNYAGCNVFCGDARQANVLHGGDWLRVRPLPPGVHVLANADVDDEADPRTVFARAWLTGVALERADDCVAASRRLLALAEPPARPICLRLPERGTVSSSILVLGPPNALWHAQGTPDRTPFVDVSPLLREIGL
jgi:uncharacterized protein with NRDE domain